MINIKEGMGSLYISLSNCSFRYIGHALFQGIAKSLFISNSIFQIGKLKPPLFMLSSFIFSSSLNYLAFISNNFSTSFANFDYGSVINLCCFQNSLSNVSIVSSIFVNFSAQTNGGVFYFVSLGYLTLQANIFLGNHATIGGVIYFNTNESKFHSFL